MSKGGRAWKFTGVQSNAWELVTAKDMDIIMYQSAKGWVIYVCSKEDSTEAWKGVSNSQLSAVCDEFAAVFKKAQGLPPKRSHDHQISLLLSQST